MRGRVVSGILQTFLLASMLLAAFDIQPVKTEPTTIIVPDDYPTIHEAINNANKGDEIFVRNGTYYEAQVTLEKPSTIMGENKIDTVIDELNISCSMDVYLDNLCVNNLNAMNATIWATMCRFKEVFVTEAKLLLSNSEAWEVHTCEKGEILGFYDLPLFGKIVFSLPFGFVFYILLFIGLFLAVAVILIYILQRKKTGFKITSRALSLTSGSFRSARKLGCAVILLA